MQQKKLNGVDPQTYFTDVILVDQSPLATVLFEEYAHTLGVVFTLASTGAVVYSLCRRPAARTWASMRRSKSAGRLPRAFSRRLAGGVL